MKKTLVSLVALMGLTLVVASCQKEQSVAQFSASMEQCMDENTKTVLVGSGLEWTNTDQIKVYDNIGGSAVYTANPQTPATTANFTHVSGSVSEAPFTAIYPAEYALSRNSFNLPATQYTEDGSLAKFPMVAETNTDALNFKNPFGALKINLTTAGVSVKSIAVSSSSNMNGDYTFSFSGESVNVSFAGNGSNTTTLVCSTAQDITSGKDFFIPMLHGNYTNIEIVITTNTGAVCTKTLKAGRSINITRSAITTINLSNLDFVLNAPDGALNALFSVSPDQQVFFSKGNLQYVGATNTWQFAANQYEYLGAANNNPTAASTIDLFGWGTSNYNGKAPYMNSTVNNDYAWEGLNSHIAATSFDWGVNNAIDNAGVAGTWRTPTYDEFNYLLTGRPNAGQLFGMATLNGQIKGMIILPDNWVLPEGGHFTAGGNRNGYNTNKYSFAEWAVMENAGAMFLPAAGCRRGDVYDNTDPRVGNIGEYWTASSSSNNKAADIYFRANALNASSQRDKFHAHAVRLIQNAF